MNLDFLNDLVIIFSISIMIVYIFHRLKLAPIVGFLAAGILVGPYGLGLTKDIHLIEVLAEIGVVILLFTIGIEFSLQEFIRIKRYIFVGGAIQVVLTILFTAVITGFFGQPLGTAIFLGFLVALSSTAIVLKTISEKGEVDTPYGRISLGILIFQDISIVPMILLIPFLSGTAAATGTEILLTLLKAFGLVVVILLSAHYIVPKVLYHIVRTQSRELFILSVILICFGTAYLTSLAGVSLALGAFLAGLVISESDYSNHALSEIIPFRDVFNSLFFVSVGMLLNLEFFLKYPLLILGTVLAIILCKVVICGLVAIILGYSLRVAILVGFVLAQIGEFSFVLSLTAKDNGLLTNDNYQIFVASAVITMMLTPFIVNMSPKFANYLCKTSLPNLLKIGYKKEEESERVDINNHVIVVGYGLNGENLSKVLHYARIPYLVLELNPITVRTEKRLGVPIFFGDATRVTVLSHANIDKAKALVVAISDAPATRRVVQAARMINPSLYIVARTRYVKETKKLYQLGANEVIPEEFETSIQIFSHVLKRYLINKEIIDKHIASIRQDGYEELREEGSPDENFNLEELTYSIPDIEIDTLNITNNFKYIGKTLAEINLRHIYGITVVAIRRGKETIANPDGNIKVKENDILIVLCESEKKDRITELFRLVTI